MQIIDDEIKINNPLCLYVKRKSFSNFHVSL